MKNSCRCVLLDYMLRQLTAKRRESELIGHPLDNACIDEMLRSGDAVCCTMVFVNFMTYCCDGCVTLTRELREIALKSPCKYTKFLFNLPQPGQSRRKMEKERLKEEEKDREEEREEEKEAEKEEEQETELLKND